MAEHTLTGNSTFPQGTSVGVYPATATNPGGPPLGTQITSATMGAGSLTFIGLEEDTSYVAAAIISGAWRYERFRTAPPADPELATQTDLDAEVGARKALFVNVKDPEFGAVGNLTADDTAAIQAAVDYVVAQAAGTGRGATIFFPPGQYLVNGQVDVGPEVTIRFLGSGRGWTGNNGEATGGRVTYLRRSLAGYTDPTQTMFKCEGTTGDRVNVCFESMLIDGKGSTGISEAKPLIEITNSVEITLRDLQLRDHNDTDGEGWPALSLFSAFNGTLENVYLTDCGSPGAFAGNAGQGAALWIGGPTNTLHVTNLELEGCEGTDLWVGTDSGVPPSGVMFTNLKMERGGTDDPAAKPHIRIGPLAQSISFSQVFMPAFRAVPMIHQDTPATSPTTFSGLYITAETTHDDPDYFIYVEDGSVQISDAHFSSAAGLAEPNIAYIHLGADADDFRFDGVVDNPAILLDDDRSVAGGGRNVRYTDGETRLGTAKLLFGAGSPEGVKTANVGSLYVRTDGGAGTTFYVKETGTGNTGWAAK